MSKKARPPIPLLDGKIIETHCHLDYLNDEQLKDTLAKARAVGVERIITIAVSRTNQRVVREIAESSDDVWCTQGLHPHEASTWDASLKDSLRLPPITKSRWSFTPGKRKLTQRPC